MDPLVVLSSTVDNPATAKLYYGQDCRMTLQQLPAQSVHTIATSPPYWGLRRYPTGEVVLRANLTEEERRFAEEELSKLGIVPID